jgi:hypothetical protein
MVRQTELPSFEVTRAEGVDDATMTSLFVDDMLPLKCGDTISGTLSSYSLLIC